jgi:hypothetical protein
MIEGSAPVKAGTASEMLANTDRTEFDVIDDEYKGRKQ